MTQHQVQKFIDVVQSQVRRQKTKILFITYQTLPIRIVAQIQQGFSGHAILTVNKLYLQKEKRQAVLQADLLHELGHYYSGDLDRNKISGAAEARAHAWAIKFAIYKLRSDSIATHLIQMAREWATMPRYKGNKIYIRASKLLKKTGLL